MTDEAKPLTIEQWENIGIGELSAHLHEIEATIRALAAAEQHIKRLEPEILRWEDKLADAVGEWTKAEEAEERAERERDVALARIRELEQRLDGDYAESLIRQSQARIRELEGALRGLLDVADIAPLQNEEAALARFDAARAALKGGGK